MLESKNNEIRPDSLTAVEVETLMAEITVPAKKFVRLFDYMERIGIDVPAVAASVELRPDRIAALAPEHTLPALQYSRLYKAAVAEMEQLEQGLVWAAGLGGEAFELMCHCMVGARTLRDALQLAERFDGLLYPLNGYRVRLLEDPSLKTVRLSYEIEVAESETTLIP